jgi:hypothetical protein
VNIDSLAGFNLDVLGSRLRFLGTLAETAAILQYFSPENMQQIGSATAH